MVAYREARKLFSVAKTRLRESAKFLAFSALGNEPWLRHRLERVRDAGVAIILNLHRVGPNDRSAYPPLAPELFESLRTRIRYAENLATGDKHKRDVNPLP